MYVCISFTIMKIVKIQIKNDRDYLVRYLAKREVISK